MSQTWSIVMMLLVATLLNVGSGDASSQAPRGLAHVRDGVLTIEVQDEPRALGHAIYELRRLCECAIAFEEPESKDPGDWDEVESRTGRVMKVPRKGSLSLSRAVSLPLTRDDTASILRELIDLDAKRDPSRPFQLVDGRVLQVRPLLARGADGIPAPAVSLLDTPISLERDAAGPHVWLQRIAFALRLAAKRSVHSIYPPNAPLTDITVVLDARDEPARDVLDRLLSELPRQGAWNLEYAPDSDQFFVGIHYAPATAR